MTPVPPVRSPREIVAFKVGEQDFGLDIMLVREIKGWTRETPIPQSPAYLRGVINLRGAVLPIIDLGARLEIGACVPTARNVVIVVAVANRLLGLLVDAVCDIVTVPEGALQSGTDIACERAGFFVIGLLNVEERLIGVLSIDALLPVEADAA